MKVIRAKAIFADWLLVCFPGRFNQKDIAV